MVGSSLVWLWLVRSRGVVSEDDGCETGRDGTGEEYADELAEDDKDVDLDEDSDGERGESIELESVFTMCSSREDDGAGGNGKTVDDDDEDDEVDEDDADDDDGDET